MPKCTCIRDGHRYIDRNNREWIADPCNLPPLPPTVSSSYDDGVRNRTSHQKDKKVPLKKKSSLKTPKKVHFDDHPHIQQERPPSLKTTVTSPTSGPKRTKIYVDLDLEYLNQVMSLRGWDEVSRVEDGRDGWRTVPPTSRYSSQSFDREGRSSSVKYPPQNLPRQSSWTSNPPLQPRQYSAVDEDWSAGSGRARYPYQSFETRTSERTTWMERGADSSEWSRARDVLWIPCRGGKQTSSSMTGQVRNKKEYAENHEKWLRFFTT